MDIQSLQAELASVTIQNLPGDTARAVMRFEPTGDGGSVGIFATYRADGSYTKPVLHGADREVIANRLWEAMTGPGGGRWKVMLFEVDVTTARYSAQFEYEDASRWDDPIDRAATAAMLAKAERENAQGLVGEDRMTDAEREALERDYPRRR